MRPPAPSRRPLPRALACAASLFALAAACGHDAQPAAAPTLFGGINVTRDGAPMGRAPRRRLSLTLSNQPLCSPHVPTGDFFLLTADLVSYDGAGEAAMDLPGRGDFRATREAVTDGVPGSWAFARLDTFADPNACGAWDCAPRAQGAESFDGVVRIIDLERQGTDGLALAANVAISGLKFDATAWPGPASAQLAVAAPCALSFALAAPATATAGRAASGDVTVPGGLQLAGAQGDGEAAGGDQGAEAWRPREALEAGRPRAAGARR